MAIMTEAPAERVAELNSAMQSSTATRTCCPFCGVGCGVIAIPAGKAEISISGDPAHPANYGQLCRKGLALGDTLGLSARLLHPMRRAEDGQFARVSWDSALDDVVNGFASIIDRHGPDAVAFYLSGQLLTEDYYVANKLMKGFIGSANVDTNSRLCMASAVAGHKRAFGADTVPGCYEDFDLAELVVLVGSNAAWCHPVLYQRIRARKSTNAKLVIVDPRRTATADGADLFLPIAPGTDQALFSGLLVHLALHDVLDTDYIARHTTGFDAVLADAKKSVPTIEATAQATGLARRDVAAFFALFAATPRVVTAFSQGVNQSGQGTDKVNAILNCHLATGRIGKPGAAPFSLTGQTNAMGGREVGGLANMLAAHMGFESENIERVQRFWRAPRMAVREGLKAVQMLQAVASGQIKALWIAGSNPAASLPEADRIREALRKLELLVISDNNQSTDTITSGAHILLPALAWGEKSGSVTNSERVISRQRAFLKAPGETRPDWGIFAEFGRRMGFDGFDYASAAEVFREHAHLSCFENNGKRDFDIGALADLSDAGYDTLAPTQWPARADETSGSRRFFAQGGFFTPDRKARFISPAPALGLCVSEAFPLRLNTGRSRDQWHTMTRTGLSARLARDVAEPVMDVCPEDGVDAGLVDGGFARVTTACGSCILRVRMTDRQTRGHLFVPIHWTDETASDARVGALVATWLDPVSGQPDLKTTPAKIKPVTFALQGFLLARAPVIMSPDLWWTRVAVEHAVAYRLAGDADSTVWLDFFRRLSAGATHREFLIEKGRGLRCAAYSAQRVTHALFLGHCAQDWEPTLAFFHRDGTGATERFQLLAAGSDLGGNKASPTRPQAARKQNYGASMIDDASVDEEILHRCTFFQGITEKSRRALLETASAVTVNQGAMIFSAGEPWAAVYVVLTGSVRISVAGDAGEALVLRVLGRGELLGDELMFGNEGSSTHAYSACGAEDTVLLRLERAALQDIAAQEPSLFRWDPQHRGDVAEKDALARSECYRLLNSLEAVDPQAQVSFAAGDIIFKEGDDADAVWLIVEGEVIVYPEATPEAPYARLGPGQCFGEKACLNDAPRSATVRALTALAVTRIARDQFVRLHDVSPALRAIVSGLEFTYQMPKCGIALSYVSEKGGESMIERVYRLDDGRRFLTSWVPAKHAFRLESTDLSADDGRSVETVRWTGSASGEQEWQRTIRFSAEGVICGFASLGDWPEMPQAIEAAINAVVFGREALETFRKTGRLDVTRPAQAEEQACFCVQLSVDKFLTLVSEGYDTFEKLREKNGCGSVCGGCEPQVQAMLGRAAWTSVVGHARAMTSDIRSILLKPSCAAQLEWKTGQHVVLSGRLGVHWINRSYTIVSAPGRDSVLEIAVKKEPKGLLSGWLFEEGLVARELRISAPRGDAVWQPGLRPTVCFAAGIGITPAVAISRAHHAAAVSMPLHVDYSGKAAEEMAYLSELEDRAATDDAVSLQCRFTATGVRLSAEDVRETARQFPEADFFVCGPEPYMSLVIGALRQAQVPEDHIFDERFTHAGAPLSAPAPATPASEITWSGPDALFLRAQDAALAAGLALVPEELVKRERHPLDRWDELVARADANTFPEGLNVYLTKFHGLFYTAPAQRAFMCRLRIPNGLLRSWQLRGLANVAAACGGDYVDVTTRANLQIREIPAHQSVQVLLAIRGLGLTAQGAGADNLRNITGSPTAGIDPQELMDTRPLCEALHHYILNHREMYGLPRKFNIAFDGGGRVGVLEDTNDIGFVATNVLAAGDVAPGVYFRLLLGGITGHQDFAFDTGVFALPSECVGLSAAIVRVFIRHGDRSNRTKARLKYVLDNLGREAFLAAVEIEWGSPLRRLPGADLAPRLPIDRQGHVGVHPQKQTGRHYLGVVLPVGRISAEQMRGLADIADRFGSGTVRLTVWQNLLISDISTADLDDSVAAIRAIGLDVEATSLRRGLVACTGSAGCKFGAADTKRHALELVDYLEARFTFDGPLNIHLTGCRNSCAQHYIGDIGLAATKIEVDGGMDEGYHVYLGGGAGAAGTQAIARVYAQSVSVAALFPLVEKLIGAWQGNREGPAESFGAFCQRHDLVQLKALAARVSVSAAAPDA